MKGQRGLHTSHSLRDVPPEKMESAGNGLLLKRGNGYLGVHYVIFSPLHFVHLKSFIINFLEGMKNN